MEKYKSVLLTQRGGPEVLQLVETELRAPKQGEVRIKVLACGVGRTDVAMRYGYYPYAPKIPFVPGYEIIGEVDQTGTGVSNFQPGDRVAALTVYGGYSEYIYLEQQHLVKVPEGLDPAEAVSLILNYITAYQAMHRTAGVKAGDRVLITGASGGVGSALLDLGRLAGLKMYGLASSAKHEMLQKQGGLAIDYRQKDWMTEVKSLEPAGLDFVFDGIGGPFISKGFKLLRKGGHLVEYGFPDFIGMLKGMVRLSVLNALPNGRKADFYGISRDYQKDPSTVQEDMAALFNLLKSQQIRPLVSHRMALAEAAEANRLLESGKVSGKVVLLSEELL